MSYFELFQGNNWSYFKARARSAGFCPRKARRLTGRQTDRNTPEDRQAEEGRMSVRCEDGARVRGACACARSACLTPAVLHPHSHAPGNSNQSVEAARECGMACVVVAGRNPVYELTAADCVVRQLDELSFVNLKQLFRAEELAGPQVRTERQTEAERLVAVGAGPPSTGGPR
jgi:hypothetical protein